MTTQHPADGLPETRSPDPGRGLRERKKAQTRGDLQRAASALFAQHGFTATTVAQIADAANVSERTFFRYFPSKEALLLPDILELFETIKQELRQRPDDEAPLTAVRESMMIAAASAQPERLLAFLRSGSPEPRPFDGQLGPAVRDLERDLAKILHARLTAATPGADEQALALNAAVTAAVAVATARTALRTHRLRTRTTSDHSPAGLQRTLLEAFAFAQAGCRAPA